QDSGALIVFVDENKSAFASGLKKGDLIVAANDNPIRDKESFVSFMSQKEHKEVLKLKIIRDSFTKEMEIIPAKFNKNLLNNNYFSYGGMVVENISDKKRENLKLPNYVSGVFVSEISDDSIAKKAGLQKSDIIVQIDDKEILNIDDFSKTINNQINQRVHIFRNGWGFIKLLQKEEKKSVFKQ
ncbi:MAG: serine protease Do, partial [Campylobacterota bacterium]|nr:serine protease Do [Campylobacterota bacterium]